MIGRPWSTSTLALATGAQPGNVAIVDNGNSGASKTVSFAVYPYHKLTLTAACALTFTPPQPGTIVTLRLIQDATGGRLATFPVTVIGTPAYDVTPTTGDTELAFLFDGTNYRYFGTSLPRAIHSVFTANGTWLKFPGVQSIDIVLWGGGGGGGSGRKGGKGTNRTGGGSGQAGMRTQLFGLPPSLFGATESVTVGTGGGGGASQTTNSTDGKAGSVGNDTIFGPFRANGGGAGAGGIEGTSVTGTAITAQSESAGNSQVAGTNVAGNGGSNSTGSGGGGGGLDTSNTNRAGGDSGNRIYAGGVAATGGTAGGGNGNPGNALSNNYWASGGSGGGSNNAGNGGKGGAGAAPSGAGGGGGAAEDSVGDSGAGGNGGDGRATIIQHF